MLSVVIACHNDPDICNTVQSLRAFAPDTLDIVVVDDASAPPVAMGQEFRCRVVVGDHRLGVGPARHKGIVRAANEWVLLTDAHMRFLPGWYEAALEAIRASPSASTLWCGQCIGLDRTNMDPEASSQHYFGGTWNFFGPDRQNSRITQVLEVIWADEQPGDWYELPAVMGALYLFHKSFYLRLGGLDLLRSWGGDEAMLSLKFWLGGGNVRMLKGLRAGHRFWTHHNERMAHISPTDGVLNKILLIHTLLPPDLAQTLMRKVEHLRHYPSARRLLPALEPVIAAEKKRNEVVLTRDFRWYLDRFKLRFPTE